MAEIIQNEGAKKGKRRFKRHSQFIDMTPMVDLACLLLTFFMLTTIFVKPKVMEIAIPNGVGSNSIPGNRTINIIVDENNKVYWYNGNANTKKGPLPTLVASSFGSNGIRKMLLNRNRELFVKVDEINQLASGNNEKANENLKKQVLNLKREDNNGPIVLIKASEKATYGNMVDVIDEMTVCNIARYAIVDLSPEEKSMLETAKGRQPGGTHNL